MKQKIFILLITMLLFSVDTKGCNVCGGSSGGSYLGILPQFYKNFVGIRYTSKSFRYTGDQPLASGTEKLNSETFNTLELWGRLYPVKRLQIFYFIPYSINTRYGETNDAQLQGLGDISAFVNYTLVNRTSDSVQFKHMLMAGLGVKLPTGKYQQRDVNKTVYPASFQIGTGAYALQPSLIYTVRYRKIGLNNDVNYRLHFENELYYKLGNQLNVSSMFFVWQKISKKITILPQAGIYLERFDKDAQFGIVNHATGGQNLFLNAGVDLYYQKMILGAVLLNPLSSSTPAALPLSRTRMMFNMSFLF